MLIYHPAFDGYHCVFRMLLIAEHIPNLEIEKARILDFYLAFPGNVRFIRLPDHLKELRAVAKSVTNVYRDPVSGQSTFLEMRHIQEAALTSIVASGLIERKNFSAGNVTRTKAAIPQSLESRFAEFIDQNGPIVKGILDGLSKIPLLGVNGLKDRSQLMEYRYDYS